MDKSTPIGIVVSLVLIFGAILMGEGWQTFFNLPSFVLVVGGMSGALMVSYTTAELKLIPRGAKDFFSFQAPEMRHYVHEFQELSRTARREGLLALDRRLGTIEDEFMRFGLEMAVDGIEETEIEELMRERVGTEMKRRQLLAKFFTSAGAYAPAFGMVGTLIGLVQMLQNLTDPAQIGSGMAVALLTTFYGALMANMLFLPFANKVRSQATAVIKAREIVQTGVMAIVRGDNPSMIEKRLLLCLGEDHKAGKGEESEDSTLSRAA
jgi:chemotaxis protein MotA